MGKHGCLQMALLEGATDVCWLRARAMFRVSGTECFNSTGVVDDMCARVESWPIATQHVVVNSAP